MAYAVVEPSGYTQEAAVVATKTAAQPNLKEKKAAPSGTGGTPSTIASDAAQTTPVASKSICARVALFFGGLWVVGRPIKWVLTLIHLYPSQKASAADEAEVQKPETDVDAAEEITEEKVEQAIDLLQKFMKEQIDKVETQDDELTTDAQPHEESGMDSQVDDASFDQKSGVSAPTNESVGVAKKSGRKPAQIVKKMLSLANLMKTISSSASAENILLRGLQRRISVPKLIEDSKKQATDKKQKRLTKAPAQ